MFGYMMEKNFANPAPIPKVGFANAEVLKNLILNNVMNVRRVKR